jgi:hypothetical protein
MKPVSRTSRLFLASVAAVTGLTVVAQPAALALTTGASATPTPPVSSAEPPHCTPAHWGRDWLWHDGHWDRWEWDRWSNRGEWKHYLRDDRYCDGDLGDTSSPALEPSS